MLSLWYSLLQVLSDLRAEIWCFQMELISANGLFLESSLKCADRNNHINFSIRIFLRGSTTKDITYLSAGKSITDE